MTGASGGIGGAIAAALARDGCQVTITGRNEQRLDELARELDPSGGQVTVVAADVRDEGDIDRILEAHGKAYGRLDVLVNSAGGGIMAPLDSLKTRHIDLQLELNLRSVILAFKASLPLLRAAVATAGYANVVNISSAAGLYGQAGLSVYSAAKKGLVGFTEAANAEFGDEGIRSTVFLPGLVDTPLAEAYSTPPEQMIRVEDLAEAIRLLLRLSPRCLIPEISFLPPAGQFGDQ
ncbi:MAG: SDR family oxidoreductase [Actinomycetia bacterium]|nr:SDR family oxidoreductase [Actinomycetes bacterium]